MCYIYEYVTTDRCGYFFRYKYIQTVPTVFFIYTILPSLGDEIHPLSGAKSRVTAKYANILSDKLVVKTSIGKIKQNVYNSLCILAITIDSLLMSHESIHRCN